MTHNQHVILTAIFIPIHTIAHYCKNQSNNVLVFGCFDPGMFWFEGIMTQGHFGLEALWSGGILAWGHFDLGVF